MLVKIEYIKRKYLQPDKVKSAYINPSSISYIIEKKSKTILVMNNGKKFKIRGKWTDDQQSETLSRFEEISKKIEKSE
jgi:hypothetical protein